jgi:hypothetical protein
MPQIQHVGAASGGVTSTNGLLANIPSAATAGSGAFYYATDDQGGTLYESNGSAWLVAGPRGVELAYDQDTVTYVTASLAAGSSEDVTGLSITFTPRDRSVWLEAGCAFWVPSNAAARPRFQVRTSGGTVVASNGYNAANASVQAGVRSSARLAIGTDITTGVSVTYKLTLRNETGATASTITLFSTDQGASPFYLRAVEV